MPLNRDYLPPDEFETPRVVDQILCAVWISSGAILALVTFVEWWRGY